MHRMICPECHYKIEDPVQTKTGEQCPDCDPTIKIGRLVDADFYKPIPIFPVKRQKY